MRQSTRVRVLSELKQREELASSSEKYVAIPLKRSVPFENQFRWADGEIIVPKRRSSPVDSNADTENKRSTRNKTEDKEVVQSKARAARAQKRADVDAPEVVTRSKYVCYDSESEVY